MFSADYEGFRPVEFFHSFLPLTNLAASLRKAKKGHESALRKIEQRIAQMIKEQECIQVRDDLREVELSIKYVKGTLVSKNPRKICEQIADLERTVWKILDFVRKYFDQWVDEFRNGRATTYDVIYHSRRLDSERIISEMCESRAAEDFYTTRGEFHPKTRPLRLNVDLHKDVLDCSWGWSESPDRRQRTLLQDHILRREYQQALLILKLGADPNMTVQGVRYRIAEDLLPPLFLACVKHEEDRRAGKKLAHIIELIIGLLNAGAQICDSTYDQFLNYTLGNLLSFNYRLDSEDREDFRTDFFIPACELLISVTHNSDFINFRDRSGESLLMKACFLNIRPAIDYLLSKGAVVIQTDIDRVREQRTRNTEEQANEKIVQELESIRNRQIDEYMRTSGQIPRLPLSLVKVCEVDKTFIGVLREVAQEIGLSQGRWYLVISDDGKLGFSIKKSTEPSFEKLAAFVNRLLDGLTKAELTAVKVDLSKIGEKMRQVEQAQLNIPAVLLRLVGSFLPLEDRRSFRKVSKFWKESIDNMKVVKPARPE